MSNEIIKRNVEKVQSILSSKSHEKRSESGLLSKVKALSRDKCLLIDVSGSMSDRVNMEQTKWSIMQNILNDIQGYRRFAFSEECQEIKDSLPRPYAGTAMHKAFEYIKNIAKIKHIILVTDGLPDSEELALRDANGLVIDVIYIGPQPVPDFLKKLTSLNNGTFTDVNLLKDGAIKVLENKIKGLLNDETKL